MSALGLQIHYDGTYLRVLMQPLDELELCLDLHLGGLVGPQSPVLPDRSSPQQRDVRLGPLAGAETGSWIYRLSRDLGYIHLVGIINTRPPWIVDSVYEHDPITGSTRQAAAPSLPL